jgi:hypothetical protein
MNHEHDETLVGKGDDAIEAVRSAVASWDQVTTHEHRFGGLEFRVGRRELGHLHRTIADLPFPRSVRDELIAAGRARPHHVLPESGWVTVPMRTAPEVAEVIELFRRNYERAVGVRAPGERVEEPGLADEGHTRHEMKGDL